MYKNIFMYEELLEQNMRFIKEQKMYRSLGTKLKECVKILNSNRILTLSGLRHTGKTQLVHLLLEKTGSFNNSFYFNGELDLMRSIKTRDDLTILFDLYVRIQWVPKTIILQNINHIDGIKSFISDLYKTEKYKILLVWNTLRVSWAPNIEIFPLRIDKNSINTAHFWGIPQVRIIPDSHYKRFLLQSIQSDILIHELLESFTIKNTSSLRALLTYLARSSSYQSLREIHRSLKDHSIDISLLTMIDYINAAISTKVLSRSYLHDIKNNNTITSKAQYYFWDVWLRSSFSNSFDSRYNLIYLELKTLWYEVSGWLSGRFQFAFRALKSNSILSIAFEDSQDKNEVRKTARKLHKLSDNSHKYVIVQNKNSLTMRKFVEESVKIVELQEFLEILGN